MSFGSTGAVTAATRSAPTFQLNDNHIIATVFVALIAIGIYLAVDKKSALGAVLAGASAFGGVLFAAVEYRKLKEHGSLHE